jgi:hypothetical protein
MDPATAAELLKIDQPKISAPVRGDWPGFSLGLLVFVVLLGREMEIVKPETSCPTSKALKRVRDRGRFSGLGVVCSGKENVAPARAPPPYK